MNILKVYIIDDDLDDQAILIEALKDLEPHVECFTAKNGQEAINTLDADAIPFPSLIFLDINMPRFDGRKFIYELKHDPRLKSIPVIIYSTSSNKKEVDEMMLLGAADFIVKQAHFDILKAQLNMVLSISIMLHHPS